MLTIDSGSTLDITNTHLILSDTSSSTQTTILGYLASGYNGGHWNGTGIISSTAASGSGSYGVGYCHGNVPSVAGLSSGQIEIAYALYGDTNLDGTVNSVDFGVLASNFGKSVSGGWQMGDFTYGGNVNSIDFGLLAENFGKNASGASIALSSGDWAALDAFAAANGISISSVPNPASIGVIGIFGLRTLARRRRRVDPTHSCHCGSRMHCQTSFGRIHPLFPQKPHRIHKD